MGTRVIFRARISNLAVKTKGKGEETVRVARLVLEVEDPDDWALDMLTEAMNGARHTIAIDEGVSR